MPIRPPKFRTKIPVQYMEEIKPGEIITIDNYDLKAYAAGFSVKDSEGHPIIREGDRTFLLHTLR